ncbi:MAG: 2-oxoglutarate dehydrogenase E1 component, partial [Alteromonadaceae bacterium]
DMVDGVFHNLLDEIDDIDKATVDRVVLCGGKVYYDLLERRRKDELNNVAIIRVEQLYPFPHAELREMLAQYTQTKDFVWCQEEPRNQGAWYCSSHNFSRSLPQGGTLTYAGRRASASPAVGYLSVHNKEQRALVEDALTIKSN